MLYIFIFLITAVGKDGKIYLCNTFLILVSTTRKWKEGEKGKSSYISHVSPSVVFFCGTPF